MPLMDLMNQIFDAEMEILRAECFSCIAVDCIKDRVEPVVPQP